MMDTTAINTASELLIRVWKEGAEISELPEKIRPSSRQEGYLIQALIEQQSKAPLFGWKIAATSVAGQKHIGINGPIAGRLLSEMVYQGGDEVPYGANRMRVAEAEFAFQIRRDLTPRTIPYREPEIMDAVSSLNLAIEIPDSRYTDFARVGGPQLIADNACGHRFVLGPEAPSRWRELDLASHRVTGRIEGRFDCEGMGANVLGDPRIALTWLVNELSMIGVTLRSGQFVTTGTCITPMEILPGDSIIVDFGELGRMSCHMGC